MRLTLSLLALLTSAFAQMDQATFVKAEHQREDQTWARKSGLSTDQVRAIRSFAGITDTTPGAKIRNIDASSLKAREQILLVESHSACTRIWILKPNGADFTRVWSLTRIPGRSWRVNVDDEPQGLGICSQLVHSVSAHVTPEGRIGVEVHILSDPSMTIAPADTYLFEWNGTTYERVEDERH